MKRYQVYLHPHSVTILDDFEKISSISRSKLIREAVDRLADQICLVFAKKENKLPKMTYFDQLAGSIDLKTKKKTNFAQTVDDIYLSD